MPEAITGIDEIADQSVVFVKPEAIADLCRFLHDSQDLAYLYLSDITAVDLPDAEYRYQVVYNLYSFMNNDWLRLKVPLFAAKPEIQSITDIWVGADWLEREVFDMFGITFTGHPDMTRILMPDDWKGHPLRKDYPMKGNMEESMLLFEDAKDILG